jgi:hypothetical protein
MVSRIRSMGDSSRRSRICVAVVEWFRLLDGKAMQGMRISEVARNPFGGCVDVVQLLGPGFPCCVEAPEYTKTRVSERREALFPVDVSPCLSVAVQKLLL